MNFICNACRCRVDYNWLHSNTSEVNAKLDYRWKTLFKFVFLCTRSQKKYSVCRVFPPILVQHIQILYITSITFLKKQIRLWDICILFPKCLFFLFCKTFANKAKTQKQSIKMHREMHKTKTNANKTSAKIIAQFVFTRSDFCWCCFAFDCMNKRRNDESVWNHHATTNLTNIILKMIYYSEICVMYHCAVC